MVVATSTPAQHQQSPAEPYNSIASHIDTGNAATPHPLRVKLPHERQHNTTTHDRNGEANVQTAENGLLYTPRKEIEKAHTLDACTSQPVVSLPSNTTHSIQRVHTIEPEQRCRQHSNSLHGRRKTTQPRTTRPHTVTTAARYTIGRVSPRKEPQLLHTHHVTPINTTNRQHPISKGVYVPEVAQPQQRQVFHKK